MMSLTRQHAVDVLALVLILAALVVAVTKTSNLSAPHDWDHFRDIALAQTVRDGAPLSDQYYRDEWIWYNPLLPWTLALGSAMTGTSVEVFHVRAGPWLNLLGPLAFYLLGIRWIGRSAAFIALAVYLFFAIGNGPGWAYATYSPWLYSNDFAEGIFFAAALALQVASDRPTVTRTVCAGALIGLTFLAHTAPALILVIMACAAFARRWPMLLTTGAVAFAVASPFLYSIGLQYNLRVVNTTPLSWVWDVFTLATLPQFLRDNAILIGLAAFGAVITTSRLLLVWVAAATVLLLYAVSSTAPVVPAFHFWKWATAAMALLAGTTLAWLCSSRPVPPWAVMRQSPSPPPRGRNLIAIALTLAAVVWHWPVYVNRGDFSPERTHFGGNHVDAVRFLREITGPNDVVLGDTGAVLTVIGPAGRKTVAPDAYLANPYVAYSPRARARDGMLAAIGAGDVRTYSDLASRYNVTAAVSIGPEACAAAFRMLPPRARFGDICISGFVRSRSPERGADQL